jgi:hypothetical protein
MPSNCSNVSVCVELGTSNAMSNVHDDSHRIATPEEVDPDELSTPAGVTEDLEEMIEETGGTIPADIEQP